MGIVIAEMSMSLDGFVADPDDGVDDLHRWYGSGEVSTPAGTPGVACRTSAASAGVLRDALANAGALITGRRNFGIAGGWGGAHPLGSRSSWSRTRSPAAGRETASRSRS
jgi:hypothetical protein